MTETPYSPPNLKQERSSEAISRLLEAANYTAAADALDTPPEDASDSTWCPSVDSILRNNKVSEE